MGKIPENEIHKLLVPNNFPGGGQAERGSQELQIRHDMNTEDVGLGALRDWKVNNSCQPRMQLLTLLQITSLNLASSPVLKTPISLQHNVYKWS